ncbi:MAG: hypothetical protein IH965_10085 [Gemmatimonadetes bacterium]|nr:hypothetical protein [Gemmatimonadota bacterium]
MKVVSRFAVAALALGLVAGTAAAQFTNQPVYFSPAGGVGLTIAGNVGLGVNDDAKPVLGETPLAYGGQATLGLPSFAITAGFAIFDPGGAGSETESNFVGNVAFKLPLPPTAPVSVSLQAGVGYISPTGFSQVSIPIGVGIALNVATPGVSVEPWVAPRVHIVSTSFDIAGVDSQTDVGFGVSGGLNLTLPVGFGGHVAVDWMTIGDPSVKPLLIGGGLHYRIAIPSLGM